MSYINFKEERFVAKDQLEKRRSNNKKIYKELFDKSNLPVDYLPDSEYSYKTLEGSSIGNSRIKDEDEFLEISNIDIICATFNNCRFHNLKFKDCKFIACYFNNCSFEGGGVVFDNCTLIKEDFTQKPSLNKFDNVSCEFNNCKMYVKFINSTMGFSIFDSCILQNTMFELSDMTSTIIVNSDMDRPLIKDVNFSGAKLINTYIKDIDFLDLYKTKFDEKTFIDKIPLKKKDSAEYEGLYMVYETIGNKFKENTLNNNFGEYYYLCKKMQNKTLDIWPRFCSYVYWISCGFGERPSFAILSSLIIIILFSILYLLFGISIYDEDISYIFDGISQFNFADIASHFNEALHLSVGLFVGVGTLNSEPIPVTYIFSNLEMLIGFIMMGIGIGTITRKIVR